MQRPSRLLTATGPTPICSSSWATVDNLGSPAARQQSLQPLGEKPIQFKYMVDMDRTEGNIKTTIVFVVALVDERTQFAIGQRAILIRTPHGNVLWDLISLLDRSTIDFIEELGGLKAIVISHPHFYTTYIEWAEAFGCPVHVSYHDREWICREAPEDVSKIKFIAESCETILPGVTALSAGGHFPGSLVLHWDDQLFVADTIMTVPAAYTPQPRPAGQTTFTFQWSIPNMIPLSPDDILGIWDSIKSYNFHTTYGAFNGMTVRDENLKSRVLESMKTQVRHMGWEQHKLLDEKV
ncbi:MAG: hypothetical protein Q9216_002674 [Gyalolechia sp. 2 TL-2023]